MTLRLFIALFLLVFVTACSTQSSWQDDAQTHIVRKGETLFSIAWRYGKSTQDIARWNRLGDGSLIYPGQILKLNGPVASSRRSTPSTTTTRRETRPLPSIPSQSAPKWGWPTKGRININFGAKPGTGTGVLINGKSGQPIRAAASGRVVYAGSGLIGYGKLIILNTTTPTLVPTGTTRRYWPKKAIKLKKARRLRPWVRGRNASRDCILRSDAMASRLTRDSI